MHSLETMHSRLLTKIFLSLTVCLLTLTTWLFTPQPAQAVNNPQLLPSEVTPVLDLANYLPDLQEQNLIEEFDKFEQETGWKLRILTQYDQSPGRAVIKFWN